MASSPRKEVIRPGQEGFFHCWSRCVRGQHLMGFNPVTGEDCSHRRGWMVERLALLCSAFAIDVAFFAIMGNHFHLVLRVTPRLIKRMGDEEVARRWLRVFPGRRVLDGTVVEPTDEQVERLAADKAKIKELRGRLSDVSTFMAALKEHIARRANLEEGVSGRFWEGRFKCREVLGEDALLTCGMYVDLNSTRAGESTLPHNSSHCSAALRLQAARGQPAPWLAELTLGEDHHGDMPAASGRRASDKGLLPLSLEQYMRLLTWAGTEPRKGKASISAELAEAVESLGIEPARLAALLEYFPGAFRRLIGRASAMTRRAADVGKRWFQGARQAARFFN